ncbi:MAG: YdbL family protein [Pseudomonadota bacterium]
MKRSFFAALIVIGSMVAAPAFAIDLQEARSNGMVGEKLDGYVSALKPSADVNALVADVNAKRLQEYTRISKQNNEPVAIVAKLAAPQIIGGLGAGSQYQASDGSWKTK